jgi:exosortase/archaeosortase
MKWLLLAWLVLAPVLIFAAAFASPDSPVQVLQAILVYPGMFLWAGLAMAVAALKRRRLAGR